MIGRLTALSLLTLALSTTALTAQTFDVIHKFDGLDGTGGFGALTEGADGNFYGTSCNGGTSNFGTVFQMTPAGSVVALYSFPGTTGGSCPNGVVLARDGFLYGTTSSGGTSNLGTIFQLSLSGTATILHSFAGGSLDGASPTANLIQATDGDFYGTTSTGGPSNLGTVFRTTSAGVFTVMHAFAGGLNDGARPTPILQAHDGNFYGATADGGSQFDYGTIFRMTPAGTVTIVHAFTNTHGDGQALRAPLTESANGYIYAATAYQTSLSPHTGTSCRKYLRFSLSGGLTLLNPNETFCDPNGIETPPPLETIVAGPDGTLFGTRTTNGPSSIFMVTPQGDIRGVHDLSFAEGGFVFNPLLLAKSSLLYGTTAGGVANNAGIFRLKVLPDTPASLKVSSSQGIVRLSWAPVTGAVSYTVKRGTAQGSETVLAAGLTATSFTDAPKTKKRVYYIVTAVNKVSESFASNEVAVSPGRAIAGDFDGDGMADVTVFRPSTGVWYRRFSSAIPSDAITWGAAVDVPVPGDYDGDGLTDIAVFRAPTGTWYMRNSATPAAAVVWGGTGDMPAPGDYDGDGKTDIAVFRPSTGTWYVRFASTGQGVALVWGEPTDVPAAGDYDGDGLSDVAVFRPSSGVWYIRRANGLMLTATLGASGDQPVPGDYDADGTTDVAVRTAAGPWLVRSSAAPTSAIVPLPFGDPTDTSVPGDFDGDGVTDLAVFRPSTGDWYLRNSSSPLGIVTWGGSIDWPILKP